jgi:thiamine biosynthesis lipoprotein
VNWLLPEVEEKPQRGNLVLLRAERRAMATTFEIAIPYGTPNAVEAAEDALDEIDRIEQMLTVYRDDSDVSLLNANSGGAVSSELFQLLQTCAVLSNDTAGAFDVAIGSMVKCWGFHKREGRVPTEQELSTAMFASGQRHVVLDDRSNTVKYLRPVELNFGAIGKGYALDRAAVILQNNWGIHSALLHGGGSSVRAVGCPPTNVRGWPVALRHPAGDVRTLGVVYLNHQGLGTSAATYQHFEYAGKQYGHVLDPRTGRPADGVQSASCVAGTAALADALSTAMFVAGPDWTNHYCRTHPDIGGVLLVDEEKPTLFNLDAINYDSKYETARIFFPDV